MSWDYEAYKNTKKMLAELKELKTIFQEQATNTPSIIKHHRKKTVGDEFIKYNDYTATSLVSIGTNIQQLFKLDFKQQLATIFTLQDNKICSTETKKLSDMPSRMVKNAQQAIKQPTSEPIDKKQRGYT